MLRIMCAFIGGLVAASAAGVWLTTHYRPQFRLPKFSYQFNETAGVVTVSGTWIIDGDKGAFPRQSTTIHCDRDSKSCMEATAILPTENSLFPIDVSIAQATVWDSNLIQFEGSAAQCVSYYYSIDLSTQSVTGTRKPRQDVPAELCQGIDDQPLRLRLVDGDQLSSRK